MNDLLKVALSQYGQTEIKGEKDNPIIVNYFHDIGFNYINDDETPWCSCFVNWCALKAGYERSKKLNARSWLEVGKKVMDPEIGDIVVYWRESKDSWKGHVGIFIRRDNGMVYTLGGNQGSGSVNIKAYPESKVLGYVRLNKL